ncbi:acyl carrier protein [Anaerocolumna xylanovorans]|uniref:Acyl carrier protein n=1 Tax=Anaerocolumna xylanovorans DSM 12503 TaxID=1121345 RepID=A0A1M7YLT7_9FIRM|nr:phosphopantetheine-binding protein [Anaerocolumna xylanovorans]SHO53571.1 acyl carrier protein [Anaerocolumna xylanovorans DSM 12503]
MTKEIIEFISDYYGLNITDIHADSELVADLGLQSYDVVEMCCQLEENYMIEISEEDIVNIRTVQELSDYVTQKQIELQN